jgi:glycosyltransferase involved in cell wall biosynthesis
MSKISVVVPCYNEQESLPLFYAEMDKITKVMKDQEFELLFVDDGSKDDTLNIVKGIAENDERVKYISFSRNFGKESAIYAGFSKATGDYVVMMDADLQDPPSLLPEMFKAVTEEGYDSVATRRVTRKGEPPIRSFFARTFYKIMNKISDAELVDGARDYRLMNRKFVDAILSMGEYDRFTKGMFGWVGFKTKWLEYENINRVAGETKWSFFKLFKYALNGIISFSTAPLTFITIMGIILTILGFGGFIGAIVCNVLASPVTNMLYLISTMVTVGGFVIFGMGILGKYVSKIHLENKKRPIYIEKESNF